MAGAGERSRACQLGGEPGTCTLLDWLKHVQSLKHYCRDTGKNYLDVDIFELQAEIHNVFAAQVAQLQKTCNVQQWCNANDSFLSAMEKWVESSSPKKIEYTDFAGKSLMCRHQIRVCANSFSTAMRRSVGLSQWFKELVDSNAKKLDDMVDGERDFMFAFKGATVMLNYSLVESDGKQTETPQYVYLRAALCVHQHDLEEVRILYDLLSEHKVAAPSPVLAYAGKEGARLATCFTFSKPLRGLDVYDVLHESAALSFGSCGIHFHEVTKEEVVPVAKLFDAQAKLAGLSNFRTPAQSIYIEPWHDGIEEFLGLKKVLGPQETLCRDMHLALWVPDEFMRRVRDNAQWPLFSPTKASDLADCYGDQFVERLDKYVKEGRHSELVSARAIWRNIIASQVECGEPSILFKDAVNVMSNESHMGTIRGSNLCAEIVQFCDSSTSSVCCVTTLSFPAFVRRDGLGPHVDFAELRHSARALQRMADRLAESAADLPSARAKNALRTRSLGIGGQGLADTLQMLGLTFDSPEGIEMNARLYENLYFAVLEQSADLAVQFGRSYDLFEGSPASKGKLQWGLWAERHAFDKAQLSPDLQWEELVAKIQNSGLRNSHLTAQPPTALSAAILGNNEGAEPYTSNMYTRSDFFGDFWVLNRHLIADLNEIGKYDSATVDRLFRDKGSVKNLHIPESLKLRYKTAWEILDENPEAMVRHSAARGPFIDQSESLNLFLHDGDPSSIDRHLFAAWQAGLKVGMYYLVMRPAREAVAYTVSMERHNSVVHRLGGRQQSCTFGPENKLGTSFEPLLADNPDRCVLFPIQHMDIWEMYKQACALIWSADELEYAEDAKTFREQSLPVQHVIKKVLAFFAVADGVVNENIVKNFCDEIQVPEVRAMYTLQAFVEEVHAEVYSRLLLSIVEDEGEQVKLLQSHRIGSEAIQKKVRWAEQYMETGTRDFPQRLVAFACVEGIMFASSFAAIFYLKYNHVLMPALTNSNELISRDEGLHRDFAVLLYKRYVKRKLSDLAVKAIIKSAVEVEKAFVEEAFQGEGLPGMPLADMLTYVEKVADHLSTALGCSPVFDVVNPFPWMDMISTESKTDRFGKRNTAYRQPGELKLTYGYTDGAPVHAHNTTLPTPARDVVRPNPSSTRDCGD